MEFLVSRLREPSTYAGIAAILAGVTFIPYAPELAKTISAVGTLVTGLLAIWMPEKKA